MPELRVIDPSSGQEVGRLPCSDADRLVETARAAHPAWARTAAGERSAALKAGARRLRAAMGVRPGMAVVEEETFGPVAAVQVVESFDEALALAEGTPYGLAAVVLTPDMGTPSGRCGSCRWAR